MKRKRKRLLVVDDDQSILFAFKRLFGKVGIKVDTSEDLQEAKEYIDKNYYNVVITDLKFSALINDAGLLISHYAKSKSPQSKVILWSAADVPGMQDKAREAKADLYLTKPVSPTILQGIVNSL